MDVPRRAERKRSACLGCYRPGEHFDRSEHHGASRWGGKILALTSRQEFEITGGTGEITQGTTAELGAWTPFFTFILKKERSCFAKTGKCLYVAFLLLLFFYWTAHTKLNWHWTELFSRVPTESMWAGYQGEQRPEYAGKNDTLYLGVGGVNGTEHSVWEPIRKKLLNFKAKERYMWAFQKKYVNYKEGSILYLQWKINWC